MVDFDPYNKYGQEITFYWFGHEIVLSNIVDQITFFFNKRPIGNVGAMLKWEASLQFSVNKVIQPLS